jgi:hypothetical protein
MPAALLCSVFAAATFQADAANYNFIKIADSAQFQIHLGLLGMSLNNGGTVAFNGSPVANVHGVYTGAGGPISTIADNSGEYQAVFEPSINDNGTVAFYAEFDVTEEHGYAEGIFTSSGGVITTIAQTGIGPLAGQFLREPGIPVINSRGAVAFRVGFHELDPSRLNFAIYKGSGGPLTLIADSSGPLFLTGPSLDMNDSDIVAFAALLDNGSVGIFTSDGGPLTTAVTGTGFIGVGQPSINNKGTLAFLGQRTGSVNGIFVSDSGPLISIAESSGPFSNFGREALINAQGTVAFRAGLDAGGQGIFTGPDPVADKVIRTGDPLFGSTVTVVGNASLSQDGTFDINDNGDIAFRYELANGVFGIAVARVVPEPTSMLLLVIGLAVVRSIVQRHAYGAN